ncbi:MAG TPA: hypothetical protein VEH84_15045 [Alphaproteobacteria bacterium]|nr:hypothetical protein [Alphaproteobacteria bacterium]
MEQIERLAELSVRRGLGFAALAIGTTMIGFSADPPMMFKMGAVLVSLTSVILFWRSLRAPERPFRRTEVWLMLESPPAVSDERAQQLIGAALQRSFRRWSEFTAYGGGALWVLSLAESLLR